MKHLGLFITMVPLCEFCAFGILVVVVLGQAYSQRDGLTLECVGNVMKLTLDSSLSVGRQLEVEAINGSQIMTLTGALASRCGYSIESDPWGNTRIYTSLLSCFTHNHDDAVFNIGLRLQLYGNLMSDDVLEVEKTCEYSEWASREILCERNFMEVSVQRGHYMELPKPLKQTAGFSVDQQASTTLGHVWKMVFYTPKEKLMTLEEVQSAGYGVSLTSTRLVLRSPYNTPESYTEDVNGVQMEVFKVNTYFRGVWSVMITASAAVCPTGGLRFTTGFVTWYMPQNIMPLMASADLQPQLLEVYMGINGKRLCQTEMKARGYTMTMTKLQIIISLPVGGPDGYYKSTVLDSQYHVTYSIEPMLEMLWLEGKSEITKYKVHYPIITPPEPRPPHVTDYTAADLEVFRITLGSFLPDVALLNITSSTGLVLSVEKANERGFNVQEHSFPNGSKAFSVEVPFSDPVVLRTNINSVDIVHSLSLTFGLLVLPEFTSFSHAAVVEATSKNISTFTMSGFCDATNFYIAIGLEVKDANFHVKVGARRFSPDLYTEYDVKENGTHVLMTVPFLAQDVLFEKANGSSLRARFDVVITHYNWLFRNFSLACTFPLILTECYPNGSITTLAVKVEAASQMIPSELTLLDPSCKPVFSNNRFAFFSFDASSCQTSRTFSNGTMTYTNKILMGNTTAVPQLLENATSHRPDYSVVCNYKLTKTLAVAFSTRPQASKLHADPGFGELRVRMRLARDVSYSSFFGKEDYPVVQYLKQPLYLEVELMQSTDPQIALILENCWVSSDHRGARLSWDLIVNGCANPDDRYQVEFYPVPLDDRVRYPSHVRRFKVDMFTFVTDDAPLHAQVLVHCRTVLCDVQQTDGLCNMQCPFSNPENVERGRRSTAQEQPRMWVSSGRIFLSAS